MPKDTEAKDAKAATPYDRPKKEASACTLSLSPRTCYPKNPDGTLDTESGKVSKVWLDGTLACDVGDGSKGDFWLRVDEAMGGIKKVNEKKATRFFLYSLRECSCGCFHTLKNLKIDI